MSDGQEGLKAPDGQVFHKVAGPIAADEASGLVAAGALVMIDPCGDGCVGIEWLDEKQRRLAAKRGMRLKRRRQGVFERWESNSGKVAVFVDGGNLRH